MRLGLSLPQYGKLANHPDKIARFAEKAELLGAESLWVGDRALAPVEPTLGFTGAGPGPFPPQLRAVLDPFTVLTLAATSTQRVRLGSSVLNAPWYSPVLLARSLTAIDRVSNGRLTVGLGTGWSPDEFRALGVPLHGRGARMEEILDVLEAVWEGSPATHEGERWDIPPSYFDLRPAQQPRPPLYLGGSSEAALARVGRRADGWLPSVLVPGTSHADELPGRLATVRNHAEKAGRDPDTIDVILRVDVRPDTSVDEILEVLHSVEQRTGIDHALIELLGLARDVSEAMDIAAQVLEHAATLT